MRKMLTVIMAALIAFASTSVAHAQVSSSRAGFVEDEKTVGKDVTQLEAGYSYFRNGGAKTHNFGEALIRYGLSDKLEIRAYGNSYQVTRNAGRTAGLQDSGVSLKATVVDGETSVLRPRIGVEVGTSLPTGANVYQSNYQPFAAAYFSWDIAEDTNLNASLAYRRADIGGRSNQVAQGVQLTHQFDKVGTYGEVFNINTPGAGGSTHYAGGGVTYLLKSDLLLDVRGGHGLNGVNKDFYYGFGVTKKF